MKEFEQMASDANNGNVIQTGEGAFARVLPFRDGKRKIQTKAAGGKWETVSESAGEERNAAIWAGYRAEAERNYKGRADGKAETAAGGDAASPRWAEFLAGPAEESLEVAAGESARLRRSPAGMFGIDLRTGRGKWQNVCSTPDAEVAAARWAEYGAMAAQHARDGKSGRAGGAHAEALELVRAKVGELEPHPDAQAYGADADDRAALGASAGDVGILEPLACVRGDDGRLLVIDGCGRLEAAREAGAEEVPCVVYRLDGLDARNYAAHKNAMGRKRSSGSRVLTYVAGHERDALAASESAKNPEVTGELGGRGRKAVPNGTAFSAVQIAKRLCVHRRDVLAAVNLLRASRQGKLPDGSVGAWRDADAGEKAEVEKVFKAVLAGRLPVARWLPAVQGKVKTEGNQGKAETNVPALTRRTFISLKTIFAAWYEMAPDARADCAREWGEIMEACPEELRAQVPRLEAAGRKARRA